MSVLDKKPIFLIIFILLAALLIASGPIYVLAQGSGDGTVGPDYFQGEKITHPGPGAKGAQETSPQEAVKTRYGPDNTAGLAPPATGDKITHPAPGSILPVMESSQPIRESFGPDSTAGLTKQESEPLTHPAPGGNNP